LKFVENKKNKIGNNNVNINRTDEYF